MFYEIRPKNFTSLKMSLCEWNLHTAIFVQYKSVVKKICYRIKDIGVYVKFKQALK
jgi:hypothetical protein